MTLQYVQGNHTSGNESTFDHFDNNKLKIIFRFCNSMGNENSVPKVFKDLIVDVE